MYKENIKLINNILEFNLKNPSLENFLKTVVDIDIYDFLSKFDISQNKSSELLNFIIKNNCDISPREKNYNLSYDIVRLNKDFFLKNYFHLIDKNDWIFNSFCFSRRDINYLINHKKFQKFSNIQKAIFNWGDVDVLWRDFLKIFESKSTKIKNINSFSKCDNTHKKIRKRKINTPKIQRMKNVYEYN